MIRSLRFTLATQFTLVTAICVVLVMFMYIRESRLRQMQPFSMALCTTLVAENRPVVILCGGGIPGGTLRDKSLKASIKDEKFKTWASKNNAAVTFLNVGSNSAEFVMLLDKLRFDVDVLPDAIVIINQRWDFLIVENISKFDWRPQNLNLVNKHTSSPE